MKGGITSGIVYPPAIKVISDRFTFRNIGGTSAGAIAAAMTAAAEYRRCKGDGGGFTLVNNLPDELARNNTLSRLFTPNKGTARLFRTLATLIGRPTTKPPWVGKVSALIRAYAASSWKGAIPGLIFLALALYLASGISLAIDLLAAAFIGIVGLVALTARAFVADVLTELPANQFGLCSGISDADADDPVALSNWLSRKIDAAAGLPADTPLTFGMLWQPDRGLEEPGLTKRPDEPAINLEVIATNVTWGRPYSFPFEMTQFLFDPIEFEKFLPKYVIRWMTGHPREAQPREQAHLDHYQSLGLHRLPCIGDLPVIFATRLSLSFPVLLSAVPLYSVDWSLASNEGPSPTPELCWWSDGGISSNFPISLFDSPLPRWPTFGITLGDFPPPRPGEEKEPEVWMPSSNNAGILPQFLRFTDVPGFGSAIANAMQNWNDNTQSRVPGYRDRIVTIYLHKNEGGLNLDMPSDVLMALKQRGAAAGQLLVERFSAPSDLGAGRGNMDWENHRWVRYRTAMAALQEYVMTYKRGYSKQQARDVPYSDLVNSDTGTPAHHYPLPQAAKDADRLATAQFAKMIDTWVPPLDFEGQSPQPSPLHVIRPKI
jgi:hypothetical protein